MRIIHSLEGISWSGGQQQTLFLCQGMVQAGHEVLLVCPGESVLAQRAAAAGVRVQPVPFRRELDPATLLGLYRAFKAFRPDLVNVHRAWAHTMWALVALITRFRGLIVTRRVLFRPDFNPISLAKYRTPAVRGYIAVSEAVAARLTSLGIPERRVKVVYPATDTDRFDPDRVPPLQEPLPPPPGAVIALMIGNYHPNKGHLVLLEAFRQVAPQWPDLHLVLVGTGTDGPALRERVTTAGLAGRVHLLGFRNDVPALIAASQFTINASFEEGLAGTIRESAAMGVPVLASDNASNQELGRRLPLTFFRTGSAPDLAEALLRFRQHAPTPAERQALRRAAIGSFSVPAMVEATLAAYRALVPELP